MLIKEHIQEIYFSRSRAKLPFSPGWCYHPRQKDPLLSRVLSPPGTKGQKFSCRGIPHKIPLLLRVVRPAVTKGEAFSLGGKTYRDYRAFSHRLEHGIFNYLPLQEKPLLHMGPLEWLLCFCHRAHFKTMDLPLLTRWRATSPLQRGFGQGNYSLTLAKTLKLVAWIPQCLVLSARHALVDSIFVAVPHRKQARK
jgi:hypothetical protein